MHVCERGKGGGGERRGREEGMEGERGGGGEGERLHVCERGREEGEKGYMFVRERREGEREGGRERLYITSCTAVCIVHS